LIRHQTLSSGVVIAHLMLAVVWVGILLRGSATVAIAYFLASRLAYVVFVGFSLRAQDRSAWWTRRWGPGAGYQLFKRLVTIITNNDAVSIGLVCWTSRGSLIDHIPQAVLTPLGLLLVIGGVGMKVWAATTLGQGCYYWKSFFTPPSSSKYVVAGPYRWFENPMYTVGYLHAYGIAFCLASVAGLIVALVAQVLVLALNEWVEKPHTRRIRDRSLSSELAA